MRRAGQVVREVLELVRSKVKPGATTLDLEKAAEARLNELGVKAAFKGYHGYPCVLCTSVNSEVVHGIPSPKRVLKEGDIVSVDFGAVVDGYYGDAAITVPVGAIDANAARLLKVTEEVAARRALRRSSRAQRWAMWAPRCRAWSRPKDFRWYGILWATASASTCTRIRRCRTLAKRAAA